MPVSVLAAQLRRMGVTSAIPLMAGAAVALVGKAAAAAWSPVQAMALSFGLQQVFIICAGVSAAVAVTGDPLVELHEATPATFRRVQLVRAAIATASGVVGAVLMFAPLHLAGVWMHDKGWITLLSPAGAVIVMAAAAFVATAFTGAVSTTAIAVVTTWMFLAMLWDPYVEPLLFQRGVPVLAAGALAAFAWRRLGDAERNVSRAVTA